MRRALFDFREKNPSVYGKKRKKDKFHPYKKWNFTDPIAKNTIWIRTFYGAIRLKFRKMVFLPYRTANLYGSRYENPVLNRTDGKIVAKSTVKNRKIPFLTVNLDFLYGYVSQISILNRNGVHSAAGARPFLRKHRPRPPGSISPLAVSTIRQPQSLGSFSLPAASVPPAIPVPLPPQSSGSAFWKCW